MLKENDKLHLFSVFLVTFCVGFINIVKAEEKATNVVTSTIEEATDVIIVEGQIENQLN